MSQFCFDTVAVMIGLGNPGPKYHWTRHNIGFLFLDYIAQLSGAGWRSRGNALIAEVILNGRSIMLIKPQTFMNSSGDVWSFIAKQGVKPEQVVVVHDELEKKFGTFQMRLGGSARGHNGLRSLIGVAGEQFWRLRLGIDRPVDKAEVPHYVLAPFSAVERASLNDFFDRVMISLQPS